MTRGKHRSDGAWWHQGGAGSLSENIQKNNPKNFYKKKK